MQTDVLAETFPYPKGRRWHQVFDTKDSASRQAIIRDIFDKGQFRASVDFPPSLFADDLAEMYPDAKVSLKTFSDAAFS